MSNQRSRPSPGSSAQHQVDEASEGSMGASDPPAFTGVTAGGPRGTSSDGQEQEIRRRAYERWLEAGRPDGREEEFWLEAERDVTSGRGSH